jgi:predicted dehydrogenase
LVALPAVIPATALGTTTRAAPSNRITMGFIGVGTQGGGHLRGGGWTYLTGGYLAREDVQVLAVCDVARARREGETKRVNDYYAAKADKDTYKSAEAYMDFRDVLARADVDAVLIATPIYWHAIMAVMAVKAGKDVYCEKPTAMTVAEGRAVADAVRGYGRVYQGGTQQRSEYGGKFRIACELVRAGKIGKLKTVYSCIAGGWLQWGRNVPAGGKLPVLDPEFDLYLGPAPSQPPGRIGAHSFGTGPTNWGQHHWDIVQWGIGADDTGPSELWPGKMRFASGIEVIASKYPDATLGLGGKVKFDGSQGGAVFVGSDGLIAVDRDQLLSNPSDILRQPLGADDPRLYSAGSHSGNFLDCVRTRRLPVCNAESSCRAASLMLLAGIADQVQRPLRWDPVKERFIGDAEADRLLSTSYRPPWSL